jgi:hypothetical protein
MSEAVAITGAYGPWEHLSAETEAIFHEAIGKLLGVGYTPLLVSKQVVEGVNYIYAANAVVVYPGAQPYPVTVKIFKPLKGPAHVQEIKRLK